MKTIRSACFETNSSSSHSISIADVIQYDDTISLNNDGNIVLTGGEFGWGVEDYNDALTKANYCAVDCLGDELKMKKLISVLKEMTGAKEVIFDISDDYRKSNYGYIDHQSVGTSNDLFFCDNGLKDFIFCSSSTLLISNDNL